MKKNHRQPLKIVDYFFETPYLWRSFALKQMYEKDESYHPGVKSKSLDEINLMLFHQLASKIIKHTQNKKYFERLKIQFAYTLGVDSNDLPPHRDESFYNVAGVIYLQTDPVPDAGTAFYAQHSNGSLKKTLEIKNLFNRMIIFDPSILHKQSSMFGTTIENSRLTIIFFGIAV